MIGAVSITRGQACCYCGTREAIQADHVRSRHAGGLDVPVNLAPLCGHCNMIKSCFWPGHGYHPLPGGDDITTAEAILDAEIMWLRERHAENELADHLWAYYGQPDGGRW